MQTVDLGGPVRDFVPSRENLMPQHLEPFSAVVFDMDGVLLDTEPLYRDAMRAACRDLGFELSDELHLAQVGMPAEAGDALMVKALGPNFPLQTYNDYCRRMMAEMTADGVPVKDGARELLFELKVRGIPAAVATSTGRPTAPNRLRAAGLDAFFAAVVTRSDVTNGKPHPEPFLLAAERLGVDPALCLALEDSHNGIRAAHAAGMRAIMVPDLLQATEDIMRLCHAVMPSLHHVRKAAFPELELSLSVPA